MCVIQLHRTSQQARPPFLKMHIHFVERSRVRLISNSIKNNNGLPGAQAPSDFKQFLSSEGGFGLVAPVAD